MLLFGQGSSRKGCEVPYEINRVCHTHEISEGVSFKTCSNVSSALQVQSPQTIFLVEQKATKVHSLLDLATTR